MNNEKTNSKRGPMHGPNFEKPKDLKKSLIKLFKNLKAFKIFIFISLILAMSSSILSLIAPNKLSDLTDEVSKGIIINSKNIKILTNDIKQEVSSEEYSKKINEILNIKFDNAKNSADKKILNETLEKINKDEKNTLSYINKLPNNILNLILEDSIYNGTEITKEDKTKLINSLANNNFNNIPNNIESILLSNSKIDNVEINSKDKIEFINILGNINEKTDVNTIYKKVDELPNSIKKIIEPTINMKKIKEIAKFLVIIYICSALFNFIQSILMTDVANKFAKKLRSKISIKINKLPLKYFDNNLSGDILSRVTNDVDTIAQSMNQSLATLVSSITLFIGSIIMMFYTNGILAITAILASLIGFVFMFKILGKSQKYFIARQVELGKLNGHIEEIYSGLNVVKVYNGKKDADKKFDELNKNVYECNRKSQFLSGLMQPMMGFIGNFGYVAVCIVGALLVSKDAITFGVIIAFITYVRLFTSPLSQIAQAMTSLQSTAAASERVFEFLEEQEMEIETKEKYLNPKYVKGKVEFSHVKFGYNEDIIIKDFTANIKSGEKVAIVGPTGAGKTTMVNLLMKFYNINSGDIKIDGISINELTRDNIHSLFTMVLQDTWVFNGTIKENIVYNHQNISDEEIRRVCKEVGVDHFIETLPNGYESLITDSDSISSGQKQLITIARGMLDKAPLLILDEATSNVDTRTEELVSKAMDKLTEGRTSFIIAHRLSTIKNANLILVMKDGNIIEQGNHEQLMKQNGFYAELYNSQFQK